MQGIDFSYGLLAALAIALLIAAVTDLRRRQIDNWLNAAIAAAAPLYWWASGYGLADIGWQLGLALATFAVTTLMFVLRGMGGGDVKLLTALALWIAPLDFMRMIVMMALIGGMLSVFAAARNLKPAEHERVRTVVAKVAASLWVVLSLYAIFVIGGGTPLPLGTMLDAVASTRSAPWILAASAAAILITAGLGVSHIVRRQLKPLPIPYGLAISAAGLWLLASKYLPTAPGTANLG